MPSITPNYALNKPFPEEFYNVNVYNANMDIIDRELKNASESGGIPIIEATSTDGVKYTATLAGLTIKTGTEIKIVPQRATDNATTFELNGIEYRLYRRDTVTTSGASSKLLGTGFTKNEPTSMVFKEGLGFYVIGQERQLDPYTYGTEDLTAGVSALETGKLHFVYE